MEELKNILLSGRHSLVLRNGSIFTFDGLGISDLRQLLATQPQLLRGAKVADKVVGKAAAALMIKGGVKALHACMVSRQALDLLKTSAVEVTFDTEVPHIENRDHSGWCPMEETCLSCSTAEECIERIEEKLKSMKSKAEANKK